MAGAFHGTEAASLAKIEVKFEFSGFFPVFLNLVADRLPGSAAAGDQESLAPG